jgi:hypothetical protein
MQKKILSVAIASVIGLAGCGGGGSSSSTPVASSTNFSGTVNKGIVSKGKVEVCQTFNANGCTGEPLATATTNADGSYTISDAPTGVPLLVKVSKEDANTIMKCDITPSCTPTNSPMAGTTNVNFGDSFEVADSWELKAILGKANSATETVNVTSLTDIASKRAISVAGSGAISTEIVTNANQAVKEAFGIDSDITEIGAVDLTSPTAVAGATKAEIEAASYSANMMTLVGEDSDNDGIDDLDELLTISSDGGYTVENAIVTSIQGQVETLVNNIQAELIADASEDGLDLDFSILDAVKQEVDAFVPVTEVEPVAEASSEVTAAKAFITDVRSAYQSADSGALATGLESFSTQLDSIDELASADFDVVATNINNAAQAIAEAVEANATGPTFTASNQVEVSISDTTLSVSSPAQVTVTGSAQNISDNNTDANYSNGCTKDSPCTNTSDISGSVTLNIAITSATSGQAALSGTGSLVITNLDSESSESEYYGNSGNDKTSSSSTTLDRFEIRLTDATLSYGAHKFVGGIEFTVEGLNQSNSGNSSYSNSSSYDEANQETTYEGHDSGSSSESITASRANVVLNGTVASNAGTATEENVGVYLNIAINNTTGYIESETYQYSNVWSGVYNNATNVDTPSDSNTNSYTETQSEETADRYLGYSVIARVTTNVHDANNEAIAASVELDVTRNNYETMSAEVTVDYNNVDTIIAASYGLQTETLSDITIRNNTGAVATLSDVENNFTGVITVGGVTAGSIEEANGLTIVRYTDGSFETLY